MLKRVLGVAAALALMAPVGVISAGSASATPLVTCAKPSGSDVDKWRANATEHPGSWWLDGFPNSGPRYGPIAANTSRLSCVVAASSR